MGEIVDMSVDARRQPFFDKSTYPVQGISLPGRRAHCAGRIEHSRRLLHRTRSDLHAADVCQCGRVCRRRHHGGFARAGGICAQVGKNCHISARAQIGGVLEPVGALPVIIEDEVLVGGNCGVYEGTIVKSGAVLGTGTILNRSTPVYDLVQRSSLFGEGRRAAGDSREGRGGGRVARRYPGRRRNGGCLCRRRSS